MYRIWPVSCASAIFAVTFLCGFSVFAVEIKPSASVDLQYTNNGALTPSNEEDDLIVSTTVGAMIDAASGPYQFTADTSFNNKSYTQNTFSDQQYFSLGAVAGWEMVRDRVSWTLQDYFSQQAVISINPDTPDNTQDTNVFTFGANIFQPISGLQSITFKPEYRKFTYDELNTNNQQNSLNVSWNYQMFRVISVGVSGKYNKVDYDNETVVSNTFRTISLTTAGQLARSNFSLAMGNTHVERENGSSERGFSGSLVWLLNVTGYSSFRTFLASDITDSNSQLLSSSSDPSNGDFSNVQISNELFRNSALRITYERKNTLLNSSLWTEFRKQDYETAQIDREVQEFGMALGYPLTSAISANVSTRYTNTELTDLGRKDTQYTIGGGLAYSISRTLSGSFNLNYQDKDSSTDAADFSEASVLVSLAYRPR